MKRRPLRKGAAVRHAYDGARGVVVRVDRALGGVWVRFADGGEDLVTAADVRPVRRLAPAGRMSRGVRSARPGPRLPVAR